MTNAQQMQMVCHVQYSQILFEKRPSSKAVFLLRILVAGERCNITGEYFERGSMSE